MLEQNAIIICIKKKIAHISVARIPTQPYIAYIYRSTETRVAFFLRSLCRHTAVAIRRLVVVRGDVSSRGLEEEEKNSSGPVADRRSALKSYIPCATWRGVLDPIAFFYSRLS